MRGAPTPGSMALALVLLAAALLACQRGRPSGPSCVVASVSRGASGPPRVSAYLPQGGILAPSRRVLGRGEALTVHLDGRTVPLVTQGTGQSQGYGAELSGFEGGALSLRLTEASRPAVEFALEVPPSFGIEEPTASTIWSRKEPLKVRLDRAAAQPGVRQTTHVRGECVGHFWSQQAALFEQERLIPAEKLRPPARVVENSCAVELTIERSWNGEVSEGDRCGSFTATQVRRVRFTTVP